MFCGSFSKPCNKGAVSGTIKKYGKFCSTLQGNACNRSQGLNKRRPILGRSFDIDLIPRHFLVLCEPTEMASNDEVEQCAPIPARLHSCGYSVIRPLSLY
jgi:hypothetical protein